MLKTYASLTKPGIIMGNVMTTISGFFFAVFAGSGVFDVLTLFGVVAGTSLIIAAGCVFNNYIDRHIDIKMTRTKKRALANGTIPVRHALLFGTLLCLLGFALLVALTNPLTVLVGATGFFFYVVMYSFWKRRSSFGTTVGSVSGATPIVAGYTAVSNNFDYAALLIFLIMVAWQMPHFYAIAMRRLKDYQAAGLPVLPAVKGIEVTKTQILLFIVAFAIACCMLTMLGYTGYVFLVIMLGLSLYWFYSGVAGFSALSTEHWAKGMFFFSLKVLLTLSLMLPLGALLP